MGRERSFPVPLATLPNAHARGQLRKCRTILIIYSSWGDRMFFGPLGLGLTVWAHAHPHAHSHALSQCPKSVRPIIWVSQSHPGSILSAKQKQKQTNKQHTHKGRHPDFRNSGLHPYVYFDFSLCEAAGEGTHAHCLGSVPSTPGLQGS